jgi:3-oxoadipate enol-lactonase
VEVIGPEDAPALVLSNALGTTSELWQPQLPELTGRFRVVLYDHEPRSSVEALGRDVIELADGLGLERFSLCGLSLGGMVGMWLGRIEPDRIDKLVLACTAARFGRESDWKERAELVRAEGMAAVASDAIEKWLSPGHPARGRFLQMQLDFDPEDYALGLEAIGAFDLRDELTGIEAPTLVIAGADDTATPPADAAFIAEGIPNARLRILAGARHLANVCRPLEFNAALLEHLSS